jgi:hypothetical protein
MNTMGTQTGTIAGWIRVNGGERLSAALTIEQDVRQEWTGLPKSDPAWTFTDSNGHFHAYDLDGDTSHYPTLRAKTEVRACDNSDHDHECDGVHITHWHCQICDEEVEPGSIPGPHSFLIEGPKDWRIEVDGRVEPAREQVLIQFAPTGGENEFFGVAVAMHPRGWMPDGGSEPRFTTVVRGAGPLGRRAAATAPRCTCDLIDVSPSPHEPAFVRGRSNGCVVHPESPGYAAKVEEAKRQARRP